MTRERRERGAPRGARAGRGRVARLAPRWRPTFLHAPILAGTVLLGTSCTPKERYEVLSFLFDGVPDPRSARDRGGAGDVSPQYIRDTGVPAPTRLDLTRHEPYQRGQCERCHPKTSSFFLGEDFDKRGACFSCHEHKALEEALEGSRFVHGPVAVSDCLVCHDPHESVHDGLLVEPVPRLCFACHDRASVLRNEVHAGPEGELCLACHDPHGGAQAGFVKRIEER